MSVDDAKFNVAHAFKAGWDRAGREGSVTPELKKALVEQLGIHPDRADQYMKAVLESRRTGGAQPNPQDFKTSVVVRLGSPAPKP